MNSAFRHCATLASGLTRNPRLEAVDGAWAYAPESGTMQLSPERPETVNDSDRGAVGHEAAHCHISHYLEFAPFDGMTRGLSGALSNAIEDPRVHEFLYRAYGSGMRRWVAALRRHHPFPGRPFHSATLGFLAGAAVGEAVGYGVPSRLVLPDAAADALVRTGAARRSYACDHLPQDLSRALSGREIMRACEDELGPLLGTRIVGMPFEGALSMLAALRAHRLAEREIAPAFAKLIEYDVSLVAGAASGDEQLDKALHGQRSTAAGARGGGASARLSDRHRRGRPGASGGARRLRHP